MTEHTDLSTLSDDAMLDLLGSTMVQASPSKTVMPILDLIQVNSKYYDADERPSGWVFDPADGGEVISFRRALIAVIDGDLPSRVAWKYDATGRRVLGEETKTPACASPNAQSPRETFWGTQIYDWRSRQNVGIAQDSCASCPLKEFVPVLDEEGKPVLVEKGGKLVQKMGAPICSEVNQYYVYIFGYYTQESRRAPWVYVPLEKTALIRAKSYYVRAAFKGMTKRHSLVASGAVSARHGIMFYYTTNASGRSPVIQTDGYHALELGYETISNQQYGSTVSIPTFRVNDEPVPYEDLNRFARKIADYRDNNGRAYILRLDDSSDDEMVDAPSSGKTEAPF